MTRLREEDPQDGARNLLLNCAELHGGQRRRLVCEDSRHGYYDEAAPHVVAKQARALGARVETLTAPLIEGPEDFPREVVAAMAGSGTSRASPIWSGACALTTTWWRPSSASTRTPCIPGMPASTRRPSIRARRRVSWSVGAASPSAVRVISTSTPAAITPRGEIAWSLFVATVLIDGETFWQDGRFVFLECPEVRGLLDDYDLPPDAFEPRHDIGV